MNTNFFGTIKFFCQKYGLKPRSWKGQNFLVDKKVLDEIIKTADLKKGDVVLEVGPGFGVLTQELAKRVKKVIAIEIDKNINKALEDILKNYKNIEIVEGNILKFQIRNSKSEILNKFKIQNLKQLNLPDNYKIVANIPYSITGHFLRKFLEENPKPEKMILMVQKEVAERIVARPGKMNLLSISVQFYGQPKIISYVFKKSFYPQPEVDSAIIKISKIGQGFGKDFSLEETKEFFRIVKIGFSSPRKQLHNNLIKGLKVEGKKLKKIFEELNFDYDIRAQELTMEDWIKLKKASLTFYKKSCMIYI